MLRLKDSSVGVSQESVLSFVLLNCLCRGVGVLCMSVCVHACTCVCTFVNTVASMSQCVCVGGVWIKDNLGCQFLPSTLFDVGSLFCFSVGYSRLACM